MKLLRRTLLGGVAPAGVLAVRGALAQLATRGAGGGEIAGAAPTLDLNFMVPGTLPTNVTFTRTTTGTFFDSAGVLQTAAINTPRWDFDPISLQLRGFLIEEARTNLLLNSATLVTQTVTTAAVTYMLSFYGTGTVVLSGTATGTLVGTGAFPNRASLSFAATAGSLTLTVTGSVLNAQLETGNFPAATSWISTAGTTVQRTADVALYPAAPLNANTGSMAVEVFLRQIPSGANNIEFLSIDAGSVTDIMLLRQAGASATGASAVFVGGASQIVLATANAVILGLNKAAMTYNRGAPNAVTVALNGGVVASGAPASLPTPTRMTFGTGRNFPVDGTIQRVRYWNRVLPDWELSRATT